MATVIAKITLAASRDIPFNKLMLSQANVRRVKAGVSIDELAESITRRGLIQSLHVRPVLDGDGQETGMFEVPAGGRRYRALDLLVKQKRLARTAPVPCVVGDAASDVLVDEISLIENIERAPLHPLDQFRAFQAMRDKGMSEEAIAAAFFVGVNVVKQRLRLTTVAPALLDVYAEDGMTLEQLMAFTVSDDHARQQQVWEAVSNSWQKEPWHVRRMLTETTVRANDKRAIFVGIEAYVAAGGIVLRDLFEADGGGWLQDAALLDRLVAEKLQACADEVAAEGWKWTEAGFNLPYGVSHGLRELTGTPIDMSDEEQSARATLQAELDRLTHDYEDAPELPDEIDQRLGEIETAIEALDARPTHYDAADIAIAGVFITVDRHGEIAIDRGYVRPADEPAARRDDDHDIGMDPHTEGDTISHADPQDFVESAAEDDDDLVKPLPERLIIELTAHRTLALRDALARHPHTALTALLHKLVSDTFRRHSSVGAMDARVRQVYFPAQADDLNHSPVAQSITDRHAFWAGQVPDEDEGLWAWLSALDDVRRMELLAYCVSFGVNALYERPNPHSSSGVSEQGLRVRLTQADRLARETGLDMVNAGWRPTVGSYLGRITKQHILAAVREGAGDKAADLISHMKKADMAREAERLLEGSGWLPEALRLPDLEDTAQDDVSDVPLPDFLCIDANEAEVDDPDMQSIAAE